MEETQFGGVEVSQERRVIHFTNGETLDLDSEEEEEEERPAFRDKEHRGRFSLKNLVLRVGRLSLFTCDFLGEKLAAVLGLKDAKYQYAIDQHQRQKGMLSSEPTELGTTTLSPEGNTTHYGATEDNGQIYSKAPHMDRGQLNSGYQAEEINQIAMDN
ncbi:hypothetical protein NL108_000223 [Boleophthalmus pectinirostris]|uniref:protein FAM177A1 n=1 Tax=Boleophthalmus pectinirostris TaxID=150288 RepID=UPI000A1C46DF|nr:protein FAM177A1 [Boleophthalmus pectinirostris]XP_020780596.1 protein FAM177A1 [Boleophthalmus pectinirostris]KAJ0060788.1 hypothetical protein NL108_000223 [Boleophthalmus pectinirostris]